MELKMNDDGKILEIKSPRLDPIEKLYVRTYLHTLSHSKAHAAVTPGIKHPRENNPYSSRDNVQFHILHALQERAEALAIDPNLIIEKLYKEAIREDRTASHSARIQALTTLGKHLGLFQDKKEKENHTFNIIHYSSSPNDKIEVTTDTDIDIDSPVVIEEENKTSLDLEDMIEITNYSDDEDE